MTNYCEYFKNCFYKSPTKFIKYFVLLICCILVIIQLSECYSKLVYPPMATYSYYDLNDTILLPAVTLCREPPYKADVLEEYGLSIHPQYEICWRNFNFSNNNVEKMFEETTFNQTETFVSRAIQKNESQIDVQTSLHFFLGKCFTLHPLISPKYVSKEYGYSIMLNHHINLTAEDENNFIKPPGWHVFIHEQKENFTEFRMKASGKLEYIFLDIDEEIEVKLQAQNFATWNNKLDNKVCSNDANYSELRCSELDLWKEILKNNKCSGPWLKDINENYCEDFESMKNLISSYSKKYEKNVEPSTKCVKPCKSTIYSAFIQNRKKIKQSTLSSQVYIYFSSKLLTIYEERPGYDFTQFVADLGGSLGFLLGLSVLGIIQILEQIIILFFGKIILKKQAKIQNLEHGQHEKF